MNAIITVIGEDKIGIIYGVTSVLADYKINVMDISQTLLQEYFTMIMLVDLSLMNIDFKLLKLKLEIKAEEIGVSITIQHEDIFKCMHEV